MVGQACVLMGCLCGLKCEYTLLYVISSCNSKDEDDGKRKGELDLFVLW